MAARPIRVDYPAMSLLRRLLHLPSFPCLRCSSPTASADMLFCSGACREAFQRGERVAADDRRDNR